MNTPIFSVVMSVYSRAYLSLAVESILGQTFGDFEFIIVDDSVDDATRALLDEFAARDARIVLRHNERNLGQTRSLNLGFRLARGRYIARQDDDDLSLPDRLEREVALLEASPQLGVVGTQMQFIDAQGVPIGTPTEFPTENALLQEELWRFCCFCHGSVVLRRECLPEAGPYDESLKPAEDYDLWLRLAEVTQLANIDTPLYLYRMHAGSQSSHKRPLQLYHSAVALERALHRRWERQPPAELAASTARVYLEAAVLAFGADDRPLAESSLASALALEPQLLAAEQPLLAILIQYTFNPPVQVGVAFCQSLFASLLPQTARLRQLKSKFVSRLYMRAVFGQLSAGRVARPREHLWPSIRHDPSWLLNRGVLAILIRSSLARREKQKWT